MSDHVRVEYASGSALGVDFESDEHQRFLIVTWIDAYSIEYERGVQLFSRLVAINDVSLKGYDSQQALEMLEHLDKDAFSLEFAPAPSNNHEYDDVEDDVLSRVGADEVYDLVWGLHDGELPFSLIRCSNAHFVVRNFIADDRKIIGLSKVENGHLLERVNGTLVDFKTTAMAWAERPCLLRFKRPTRVNKGTATVNMLDAISELKMLQTHATSAD